MTSKVDQLEEALLEWERASVENDGPSITDLVTQNISDYAAFTSSILSCSSMSDIDEIVHEFPAQKLINDHIQAYILLAERGVVEINPSENAKHHVEHAILRHIGSVGAREIVSQFADDIEEDNPEVIFARIIRGMTVQSILRVSNFCETLAPHKYPLVHSQSKTIH